MDRVDASDLDLWNKEAQIFINNNKGKVHPKFPSNYMLSKENWLKMGKFRIGTGYGWNALDAYFQFDCENNKYKHAMCLDTLIYHDFHKTSTGQYVERELTPPKLNSLQRMGTVFRS
jgi:hypothetical protein